MAFTSIKSLIINNFAIFVSSSGQLNITNMKKILLLIAVMLFITSSVIAQKPSSEINQTRATITTTQAGDWDLEATWVGGVVPGSESTLSDGEVNTSILNAYKEVNANYITIEGLATQATSTEASLYNILGTKVMDTTLDNTTNTQTISTNGFATGIYVLKLISGQNQLTKKLIIL